MGKIITDDEIQRAVWDIDESGYCKVEEVNEIVVECAMTIIQGYCQNHPTCEGCKKNKEHIGCEFRGKSPREWKND